MVYSGCCSDFGCELAYQYASRGANICLVGRREVVEPIRDECRAIFARRGFGDNKNPDSVLCVTASNEKGVEVTHIHRMVVAGPCNFRSGIDRPLISTILTAWGGLDTLIIAKALIGPIPRARQFVQVYNTQESFFLTQAEESVGVSLHLAILQDWNHTITLGMTGAFVRLGVCCPLPTLTAYT